VLITFELLIICCRFAIICLVCVFTLMSRTSGLGSNSNVRWETDLRPKTETRECRWTIETAVRPGTKFRPEPVVRFEAENRKADKEKPRLDQKC
jgi:hypothetical protein